MTAATENQYKLTPTQEAMLLYSMYAPKSPAYFEEFCYEFLGALDLNAFKSAWQQVIDRHLILRTAFSWDDTDGPQQTVQEKVELPFTFQDWRGVAASEREERLNEFLESDCTRGFNVSEAPLLRLAVLQIATDAFYIVISNHHLVLDGWSMGIVRREVSLIYQALIRGEQVDLPDAPEFSDYIAWLDEQQPRDSETFWRRELAGFNSPNALPIDKTPGMLSPPDETFGESVIDVSIELSTRLQSAARKHRLTLSTVAQGAWAILLSLYCRTDDVMFGITVSGRPFDYPEIDSLVGLLIGTLPLRARVSQQERVSLWLQQMQKAAFKLREHETTSLNQIHEWTEAPRGTALFETIVVFENFAGHDLPFDLGGEIELRKSHLARTNYPLTLVVNQGTQLSLRAVYHRSRFAGGAIARMLDHFVAILESFANNLDQTVAAVSLLNEAEKQTLLHEWSTFGSAATYLQPIHRRFERAAAKNPDATAIEHEGRRLTYRELNSRANQLAHLVRMELTAPDDAERLVGICLERSPEMIVAVLAVLKAGGAYVPLDPTYPADRLEFMLQDSGARVLLTREGLREKLPEFGGRVIALDAESETIDRQATDNLDTEPALMDLAYVIYTSGSTGKPKGVMIEHRSLANFVASGFEQYEINSSDRVLQFASLSFDTSVEEIFCTLTCGATLVLRTDAMITSGKHFLEQCAQLEITVLDLPTGYWHHLVSEMAQDDLRLPDSVRLMLLGGEQAKADHVAKWLGLADVRLLNTYGPTEATVVTTTFDLSHHHGNEVIPIGRPIGGASVYVLDETLRPVPMGLPGELYIGGDGVARGYLIRPELTSEKFIRNPFGEGRLYRSGDLVRYLSDGNLEFVGRADNQVKIRGFRIELEEVEGAIRTHEAVADAVVIGREDADGDKRLHAYLVLEITQQATPGEIRTFLKTLLPSHMLPASFTTLESFPLMPNGKIDRRALPAPEIDQAPAEDFLAPRTPTEEIVAQIWSRVLKLSRVSIHDNFFELGGHSLLAARLFSELRRSFEIELSLVDIFNASTVAQLAEMICEREAAKRQGDDLMLFLSELDDLSEEEAHRRLAAEKSVVAPLGA